ncbi:anaphase-promoting complex subunit 11 isoform X2 [Cryptomeria japonica]|uniref:anaphase-promoting complex subunit 11 isoform X2 n=1 Tax=Cryptomeria japonica TaxID=3369 RepID=UPI0025AC5BBC|nr:anaphase-promoting complex subunit 11 isoform X2 [Cryptomeria japonica]
MHMKKCHQKWWHAVASWTWDAKDELCAICKLPFDGCCTECKYPGDDCPLVWGVCNHPFHLHCIIKWTGTQNRPHCPLCRRDWQIQTEPQ